MNHLSLFSGIGGLDLAAEWAGFRTVGFVERDPYCQRVLAKHWPGVPIWDDVCAVTSQALADSAWDVQPEQAPRGADRQRVGVRGNAIQLVSGGFPCQPHSVAGKRKASADERDLWGECARITAELNPRWCVFENVPGLLSSERGTFFARVLDDLAALGYVVAWLTYGACDVGAPHRRERVFIVAHAERTRQPRQRQPFHPGDSAARGQWQAIDAFDGCRPEQWRSEPDVGRVAHGVPRRVDRLRALGNAVVPQQAYPIFKAIADIERMAA